MTVSARMLRVLPFISLCIWAAAAIALEQALPPSDLSARIDATVAPYVGPGRAGIAVAVIDDGVVVHHAGYGFADIAAGTPVTSSTRFDLASVSKQFTAAAILVLVSRGVLTLDDDVRLHLPELPAASPSRPIRVRDLLAMRSGLTDYIDSVSDWSELQRWTNLNVVQHAARSPLAFPTGTSYEYSNTNYALLALIAERVSGQPFAEFLRTAVFEPTGMHHTMLLDTPGEPVPDRARGYAGGPGGAMPSECDTGVLGDGQVFTSIDDLALWDGSLRQASLLGPELTALMFTPAALDTGEANEYAMGYFVWELGGHALASHSGSWSGTSTWYGRFIDEDLTVIVLANDENFDVSALARQVAAAALGIPGLPAEE